ncbi:MAG: hypothetical protein ACO1PI_14815 [Bacteroidota bacterium]
MDANLEIEDTKPIADAFNQWLLEKTKQGVFFGYDSCNLDFIIEYNVTTMPLRLPDSTNTSFWYGDINGDRKKDGLITFIADLCDRGNAAMWTQFQVLVLSNDSGYSVNDSFFDSLTKDFEGFIHADSMSLNTFFGTYIEFKDGDGHCCPRTKEEFTVTYNTPVIQFRKPGFKPTLNSLK